MFWPKRLRTATICYWNASMMMPGMATDFGDDPTRPDRTLEH